MNTQTHEITKKIKKELRLSMNGVISTYQRQQGLNYKINFGVEIPRIKEIASTYSKDTSLAQELWENDIRECKLLAIFLYPTEEFDITIAKKWITECRFTEIADHLCRTLLIHLTNATENALRWIAQDDEMFRYCGYSLLSNLFRRNIYFDIEKEEIYLETVMKTLCNSNNNHATQNAAGISLMQYTYNNKERTKRVCNKAKTVKTKNNDALNQLIENIKNDISDQ